MRTFIDQLGNTVVLANPPQRIISLVPSQTEWLADLGLSARVVGVTKFCVHPPEWRKEKTVIGGTKYFDFERIDQLHPDLIIGNKEENYEEGIRQLSQKYPVWMSNIFTVKDALQMMQQLGEITGAEDQAHQYIKRIQSEFRKITKLNPYRVLYLIWRNPWMAAAGNTFIHAMLTMAGLQNCLAQSVRYPQLSAEEIVTLQPEVVMLSSEPYSFKQKHVDELRELLPAAKIIYVDGEIFSWYGSRLMKFPAYINSMML
jgi:ABC-type Fe3+-hydroxamate transport system substrate-binding protein